jgi:hypothetical protein
MPEGRRESLTSDLRQPLMDERNRHGTLTDGRRTALDRTSPNIARGKETGMTRFQW